MMGGLLLLSVLGSQFGIPLLGRGALLGTPFLFRLVHFPSVESLAHRVLLR